MYATSNPAQYAGHGTYGVPTPATPSAASRWATWLSWGNLALVCGVIGLIHLVSEGWWLSIAILYLPRIMWTVPAVILLGVTIRLGWKTALINVASLLLVLGPVMNWQCGGLFKPAVNRQAYRLTVVSCNVQSFRPNFSQVVNELHRINPDVILFQETLEHHPLVEIGRAHV